jgi:hypothetical protein
MYFVSIPSRFKVLVLSFNERNQRDCGLGKLSFTNCPQIRAATRKFASWRGGGGERGVGGGKRGPSSSSQFELSWGPALSF